MMKCIDELPASALQGKRVLVRTDYNLPLNAKGEVSDMFRLKQGWKTIQYLSQAGARVLVLSHIGRDPEASMEPVAKAAKELGAVAFVKDLTGPLAQEASAVMKDGEIAMLENVRRDARETENDEGFAKELASLADIYVDDAFAAAHRAHASIVGVPKFLPHYAGFLMRDEVANIDAARAPRSPSFAILGGAKFETKAPLITLLLQKYDHVLIVGALANDVFKARGLPTGRSLISKELPAPAILNHPHFLAPIDVTVENSAGQSSVKKPEEVGADDKIVDIGPDTVAHIAPLIEAAQFVLWAGPTGMYEKGYLHYTQAIAEAIAQSKGQKVIGGGDTIAAIEACGVDKAGLGFLSTGGGAMLEYLLKGTLPGVEALA